MVDPVVEAAPLERVVQLAGAVGGEHDDRRHGGADGAELRDRHLVRRQHLEQERLELVVGPVDLVDQQHRRCLPGAPAAPAAPAGTGRRTGSSRPPRRARRAAGDRLERAQVEDLPREVPVVERLGRVDALVALQPDQRQLERLGDRLGERGLAGAGLALEQQRPLHRQREVGDRGQRVVAEVAGRAEALLDRGHGVHAAQGYSAPRWFKVGLSQRRVSTDRRPRSPGPRTRRGRRRGWRGSRGRRGRRWPTSATPAQWWRPSRTGWPGTPSYVARARRSGSGAGGGDPAYDVGRHVGQVDQRDQRPRRRREAAGAVSPARSDAPMPSAHRSATTTRTSRPVQQRAGALGLGAEHHRHRVAAAVAEHGDRPQQPRGAVVVAHQRLGRAHPGAGAGGEQESVQAHAAQPRRGRAGVRQPAKASP